jgi:hypothetical protein
MSIENSLKHFSCISEFETYDREKRHALGKDTEQYNRFCEALFEELSAKNSEWLQEKSDLTLTACAFISRYLTHKAKKEGSEQIERIKGLKNRIREAYKERPNETLRQSAFYLQNVLRPLTKRTLSSIKTPPKGLWGNISNYLSTSPAKSIENEINERVLLAGIWNIAGEFEAESKRYSYTKGFNRGYIHSLNHFFSRYYKGFLKLKTIQKNLSANTINKVTGCLNRLQESMNSKITNIQNEKLTIINVIWSHEKHGHTVNVIFYKDLVIKANRGEGAGLSPGIVVYRRKNPYDSSVLEKTLHELQGEDCRNFYDNKLIETLDLDPLFWIPQAPQTYDNCWRISYTSAVLAGLYATLFTNYLEQGMEDEEAHTRAVNEAFEVHKQATAYVQLQAEASYRATSKSPDQALLKEIDKIKREHPERFPVSI